MMNAARIAMKCLVLLVLSTADAFGGSVRLRTSATIEAGAPIRVGDVATLEGDDTAALAPIILLADPAKSSAGRGWVNVGLCDVRRALEESGARLGTLSLSGGSCCVRLAEARAMSEPPARQQRVRECPSSVDLTGVSTVRMHAALALASFLDVDPSELRLLFDRHDGEFLDQPREALRIVVQPVSGSGSARSLMSVRIFDGDRILESRTIRADAEVRRPIVVLQETVRRKDEIPPGALSVEERWVPVGRGTPLADVSEAAGALARVRLEPGTILREEHLESPIVVRRNELATIHAVREGFEVKTRARARADARRGDMIEFRAEGSKKGFIARVEGPGVAVVDLERLDRPQGSQEEAQR